MKAICISNNGIVEYYGNHAGYVKDGIAVMDNMFQKEDVVKFLEDEKIENVKWQDGVYDGLVTGNSEEGISVQKSFRIHQVKPNAHISLKFKGYNELIESGFGKPDLTNYRTVYDGILKTSDLEEIYQMFNGEDLPEGFAGYPMSKSDIIEIYENDISEFYYVDDIGFVKLETPYPEEQIMQEPASEVIEEPKQLEEPDLTQQTLKDEPELTDEEEQEDEEEFIVETFKISM